MLLAEPLWVFTEAMIDPRTCAVNQDQTEKEEKEVKNVFLQHQLYPCEKMCLLRRRLICTGPKHSNQVNLIISQTADQDIGLMCPILGLQTF